MSAAPLAGVRVVTIALNLPGPVAAARLQELGAEVRGQGLIVEAKKVMRDLFACAQPRD